MTQSNQLEVVFLPSGVDDDILARAVRLLKRVVVKLIIFFAIQYRFIVFKITVQITQNQSRKHKL